MALLVFYDSGTNRVTNVLVSASSPDYAGQTFIENPNLSALSGIAQVYWKHLSGSFVEMNQAEKDVVNAEIAAAIIAAMHSGGKIILDAASDSGIIQRAVADIARDEINILRQWLASFKIEVAAATNLADLKTRVATLPATPDRTLAQLRTAIKNRIDSGSIDS